jgi:prepilin-type N-terminal cleavage/methylation domain-containing protein
MLRVVAKYLRKNSGMTLAEVVIAMAISAIVLTGMLVAYVDGVRYTSENSSMMTMHNEGKAALMKMGKYIRRAARVRIRPYGGVSNAQINGL